MSKKLAKAIAMLAVASTIAASAVGLGSCATSVNEYYGEYSHPNIWSATAPEYGIRVKVTVQSDGKGDRIKSVEVVNSGYDEVTSGWGDRNIWDSGLEKLLLSYRGQYISDVLVQSVQTDANGQPVGVSDDGLLITGATLGSGRLLLAVQNALKDAAQDLGYTLSVGEYSYYNKYSAGKYGIRVKVVIKDGVIVKVKNDPYSGYTEVTPGWDGQDTWDSRFEALLKSYEGRKAEDIMKLSVTLKDDGEPETVSDDGLVLTGATVGSGRLLLAVQDAIANITTHGYDTIYGEYSYKNPYADDYYGIKVSVTLQDHVITSVTPVPSEYVSVSEGWEFKNIWNQNLSRLLSAYVGKRAEDILSVGVTCDEKGQPTAVGDSDYLISGATMGSGRLLLAVQNAFTEAGYAVKEGDYHYSTAYGTYGIKARVVIKGDKICYVNILPSDYTQASPTNTAAGWDNNVWYANLNNLLKNYEGRYISQVLAMNVVMSESNADVPASLTNGGNGVLVTGATQSSGRLLLAIQNALKN